VEQLIIDKLLDPATISPIVQHYYSQRFIKERYDRARLEVRLYGDAIARGGLNLIESSKLGRSDAPVIQYSSIL
jgi:hypothetical protein